MEHADLEVLQEQTRDLMQHAKIMMVDDEEINMDVLCVHLETEGYSRFVSVSDSRVAMEILRHEEPDVLLLDLFMPTVSGFDILAEIRRDDSLKSLPVLVLTSADDPETKHKALKLGATDFLAKPIDASELALRMGNTLATRAWQRRMTHVDTLTELPNRQCFTYVLKRRLGHVDEHTPPAAMVLININRFKAINDSLGPAAGDEVLKRFVDRLLAVYGDASMRELWNYSSEDFSNRKPYVSRLDGDRFVVLLPLDAESTLMHSVTFGINRFTDSLEAPFRIDNQNIHLSVKIGVSVMDNNTADAESLINEAETAMQHAKRGSDKTFAVYSKQMDAQSRQLLSLQNGLHTAADSDELFLVYQPKVNVKTNQICGAEALVRWKHPEFGLISPENFIPMAEDSGTIVAIGEWVLREACFQTKRWQDAGFPDFKIAVNVSIRQLYEPDFISTVYNAIEDTGIDAQSLIIELTENMIMDNAESNVGKLQDLQNIGIKISIDDFGTGYSSLGYLQRFPLHQLKIDRSFISEIKSAFDKTPIVKAVISLAHDLGLSVVAEGVETHHQLAHINALKCDEYQGYFCSKPVIAGEFEELLGTTARKRA